MDAALTGRSAFDQTMQQVGFEDLQHERPLLVELREALGQVLDERDALVRGRWTRLRVQLLEGWWAQVRKAVAPGSELGHPNEEQMLDELRQATRAGGAPGRVGAIVASVRGRLQLVAAQTAELERLLAKTERLGRWQMIREPLVAIGADAQVNREQGLADWERGQLAAESFRETILAAASQDPLSFERLTDRTAVQVVATVPPLEALTGEWAQERGSAPAIGLGPRALGGDIGTARFALAHQLGHVVESLAGRPVACRDLEGSVVGGRAGEEEAFANAFAVYLLAPRPAVLRLTGQPAARDFLASERSRQWLWRAVGDVAGAFGLSAGAALPHVLNCLREPEVHAKLGMLRLAAGWEEQAEATRDAVQALWSEDRDEALAQVGELLPSGVEQTLRRPRSARFDALLDEALRCDVVDRETFDELASA